MGRIHRHLSYANVTATVALVLALAGGAYAVGKVNSRDIVNDSVKSVDLKNRKAVKAADIKPNSVTGDRIREHTLNAAGFAPVSGDEPSDCDPSSSTIPKQCATVALRTRARSRIVVVATGNQESVGGAARAICDIRIDGLRQALAAQPGEEMTDNTSPLATNGFARTVVTPSSLPAGRHKVSLACKEFSGNVRIDVPTIAAIAIAAP